MKIEQVITLTFEDGLYNLTKAEAVELYNALRVILGIEDKQQINLIPTPVLQYPTNVR